MKVVSRMVAPDGTKKFLFELADGKRVEGVLIFHKRTVCACISSQVGCAMKCSFCATGKMGFSRNLSSEEILGQFDVMNEEDAITNVVFMGMGEPLMNYGAVVGTVNELRRRGLSWRKVTVSTVGIPDKMRRLSKDAQCMLAVSLHAPNDELRQKIVPTGTRYRVGDIIAAAKEHPSRQNAPVMIEYVLLAGVNDQPHHARELAGVLRELPHVMINLIPYNPVAGIAYKRPDDATVQRFKQLLIDDGYKTIVRTTKGLEAKAACGMLATGKFYKANEKSCSPLPW